MADGLNFSWKALAFDKLSDRLVFGVWVRSLRSHLEGKTFQKEDFDRNHMWWKSNFMQMTYENLCTRHPTVASKVLTFLYLFLMDIMQNIISLSFFRSFKLFFLSLLYSSLSKHDNVRRLGKYSCYAPKVTIKSLFLEGKDKIR